MLSNFKYKIMKCGIWLAENLKFAETIKNVRKKLHLSPLCANTKKVKHTQTICRQQPTNFLSVFDHFVKLALKGFNVWQGS